MQDNSETLTIKSSLTKIGKKRSAQGKLDITKVAFSDDGINYSLINDNLSDDSLLVKRQPLFDVWSDTHAVLKNKILMNKPKNWQPNEREFGASIERLGEKPHVRIQDKGKIEVPTENIESGFRDIRYYGTDNDELSRHVDIAIEFIYNEVFDDDSRNGDYVTITLFDSTYFDIMLSPDNVSKFTNLPDPRSIPELVNTDTRREILDISWNRANHALLRRDEPTTNVLNQHVLNRNYYESLFFGITEKERTPQVINVSLTNDNEGNSFLLRYRGNYNYNNPSVSSYQTFLSIMDEENGQTEYIKLSIIPENKPTN